MKEYRPDMTALWLIQAVLCLVAGGLSATALQLLAPFPIIMWITVGIFVGAGVVLSFLLLPLMFRRLRCVVGSSQISLRSGLVMQREQSIRLNTIQFVQIISGPFDGRLGMNFIILHVYGGQLAVPFLNRNERKELVAFLRQKGVFYAP